MTVPNIISGNLKTSISEHFPQFLLGTNIFFSIPLDPSLVTMNEIG